MSQKWEKINQKIVLLKVASVNISSNTVPDCVTFPIDGAIIICNWTKLKFLQTEMDYFLRKSLSKYLMGAIDINKHDVDIFINDTDAGDIWRLFKITRRVRLRFWQMRNEEIVCL